MGISAGLVGLPNVGKSTLFNALTKSSVPAENYPFCTIDPHLACTFVPDSRLEQLKKIYKSEKIVPTTVQFVDIAGLVKGAASGEGLGNQFLSHIREVDLILHVLRCFDDPNITSFRDACDPLEDYSIIMSELMLKDLESVEKRKTKIAQLIKQNKGKPAELKELEQESMLLDSIEKALNDGNYKKVQEIVAHATVKTTPLLSSKNFLIIANVSESEIQNKLYEQNKYYQLLLKEFGEPQVIAVSAKIEYELSQMGPTDAEEMRSFLGLDYNGIDEIIKGAYKHLGLISFFTCGPKEIHAWSVKKGTSIRKAGGEIHSDLEKGFICAEVFNAADLITCGSEAKLKEAGKLRTEGQDYQVRDGDIVLIRFNV